MKRSSSERPDRWPVRNGIPLSLFLVVIVLYVWSLPTVVTIEDSAEFVVTAATLGVAHPSGYPLHVLLGKLFTLLPFLSVAWRVALFSAVCSAGAVTIGYLAVRELLGHADTRPHELVGISAAVPFAVFAFSPVWWNQSVIAEVYALHVLLLAGMLFTLVHGVRTGRACCGPVFFLLLGLSCSNHLFMTMVTAPFLLVGMAMARKTFLPDMRSYALSAAAFIIGLLPYALLPLRAGSAFAMGDTGTFGGFVAHVFRLNYGDAGIGSADRLLLIGPYVMSFLSELGPFMIALAAIGVYGLARRAKGAATVRMMLVWASAALLLVPIIILGRSVGWSDVARYIYRPYAVSGLFAFTALAAVGCATLMHRIVKKPGREQFALLVLLALLLLPVASYGANLPRVRTATHAFVQDYLTAAIQSLPQDAVLVVNDDGLTNDTELFVFAYLQLVSGLRTDVAIVQDGGVSPPFIGPELPDGYAAMSLPDRRKALLGVTLADPDLSGRPVFTTYPVESLDPDWSSRSNGYFFAFGEGEVAPFEGAAQIARRIPQFSDAELKGRYAHRAFMAHALYNHAAFVTETEGSERAITSLLRAIDLDPYPMSPDYLGFVAHRDAVLGNGETLPEE